MVLLPIAVIAALIVGLLVGLLVAKNVARFCRGCGSSLDCLACGEVNSGAPRPAQRA